MARDFAIKKTRRIRSAMALMCLVFAGCIGNPIGTSDTPDEFVDAARSWEGANIQEMMSVWGPPNDGLREPSGGESGSARWQFDWTQGNCRDHLSPQTASASCRYNSGTGKEVCPATDPLPESVVCRSAVKGARNHRHRCNVEAIFHGTGTISTVEVVSVRCAQALAEWLPDLTY